MTFEEELYKATDSLFYWQNNGLPRTNENFFKSIFEMYNHIEKDNLSILEQTDKNTGFSSALFFIIARLSLENDIHLITHPGSVETHLVRILNLYNSFFSTGIIAEWDQLKRKIQNGKQTIRIHNDTTYTLRGFKGIVIIHTHKEVSSRDKLKDLFLSQGVYDKIIINFPSRSELISLAEEFNKKIIKVKIF